MGTGHILDFKIGSKEKPCRIWDTKTNFGESAMKGTICELLALAKYMDPVASISEKTFFI